MKTFTIDLPSGVSEGIGAAIRQVSMGLVKTWRPVCMGILEGSNLISSPLTVQDTTEIFSAISTAKFSPKTELTEDYQILDFHVEGEFRLSNMDANNDKFRVLFEEDLVVLTTFDSPVTLRVVLINHNGNRSDKENSDFIILNDYPVDLKQLTTYSSRHIPTELFLPKISPKREAFGGGMDQLTLTLDSKVLTEEEILKQTIDFMETVLSDLRDKISQ